MKAKEKTPIKESLSEAEAMQEIANFIYNTRLDAMQVLMNQRGCHKPSEKSNLQV